MYMQYPAAAIKPSCAQLAGTAMPRLACALLGSYEAVRSNEGIEHGSGDPFTIRGRRGRLMWVCSKIPVRTREGDMTGG